MGVIYHAADDVAQLLVPFVQRHGSSASASEVAELYERASRGELDPGSFWRQLGLDPGVEDDYLATHELTAGVVAFLSSAHRAGFDVWCFSNDVSRWSAKLRERFGLDRLFADFVVSGDIGHRKPSEDAYRHLLDRIGAIPELFVDDRPRNVSAARSHGIPSVRFGTGGHESDGVPDFAALWARIGRIAAAKSP